jgi:hypothetical protein
MTHPMHPYLSGKLMAARTEELQAQAATQQVLADSRQLRARRPRPWSNWHFQSPIVRRPSPGTLGARRDPTRGGNADLTPA